jgi:DNA-directed RNA polymerase subunit RPC12/RpoP
MSKLFFVIFLFFHNHLAFSATADGRWHVGIGDPTIFGWLTVLLYLTAVARCIAKSKESKFFGGNYQFWLYLAAFLLLLGINKQLDLQSWFTEVMRDRAKVYGWYEHRQSVQVMFIVVIAILMTFTLIGMRLFLTNSWRRYQLTWMGIVLLCTFILMRAASFHHFDLFIGQKMLGLTVNVLLENLALGLIILGTYLNKKFVSPLSANTVNLHEFIEIANEGDDARCPQCGTQPLSKPKDGRLFKCRKCSYTYLVRVIDSKQ